MRSWRSRNSSPNLVVSALVELLPTSRRTCRASSVCSSSLCPPIGTDARPPRYGAACAESGSIAQQDGDEWVIDGYKWFSSNARYAEFLIVMAVTNPDNAPHEREFGRASLLVCYLDVAEAVIGKARLPGFAVRVAAKVPATTDTAR